MTPTTTYADLEIQILPLEEAGYPVRLRLNHEQEFDGAYLQPQQWQPGLNASESGQRLAEWFFADEQLRLAWAQIRGQCPRRRLRLRLDANAPELHAIPWELLKDDDTDSTGRFIAATSATPFSRYLDGRRLPGSPILQRPIKIAVAIANPDDLDHYGLQPIEVETELAQLQAVAENLEVELLPLPQPCTLTQIESVLRQGVHVLHIVAHGRHTPASANHPETAILYMADEKNKVKPVEAVDLAAMLSRQLGDSQWQHEEKLRLIFLASCETAKQSPADAFRGFAPELVKAGVPAVLAMQDLVPVVTARQFTRTFYEGLQQHGQVDWAANEGRATLLTADLSGAGNPVLFMRLRQGQLFGIRGQILGDRADSFWHTLLENIEDGDCTPFLGPRVTADLLPTPADLARQLAAEYGYPFADADNLPRVTQFIGTLDNRRLRRGVMQTLVRRFKQPLGLAEDRRDRRRTLSEVVAEADWSTRSHELGESEIHHLLADLELPLYLTTNPDNFMTLALQERTVDARRVAIAWRPKTTREEQPVHWDLEPPPDPDRPVVLHLFGSDEDLLSLVLTEDDYLDYLARISRDYEYLLPTSVQEALASTTLLFLGYRLDDLDLKVIMRGLLANLDLEKWGMLHVAVQIEDAEADEVRRQEVVRFFQSYFASSQSSRIDVYWGTTAQFVADLHARWKAYQVEGGR